MFISRLRLKNWRNFKTMDIALRECAFVLGPNASGKSNLLDAIRFLRDVAKPKGGGLQRAVDSRGGLTKLRCLLARRDPQVMIEVDLSDRIDNDPIWRYRLAFKREGKGAQRVVVSEEVVTSLKDGVQTLVRPDVADQSDRERLTETNLEQVNANRDLRQVVQGYNAYHAVPTNFRAIGTFRYQVANLWRRTLKRRSQRAQVTWKRMDRLLVRWLPTPRILHAWPKRRFAVNQT